MTSFVWTIFAFGIVNMVANLRWLVDRDFPTRTGPQCAWDLVINMAMCAWAGVLLSK